MGKVHINLEDVEDKIAAQVQWRSDHEILYDLAPYDPLKGFQRESGAHQIGLLALKFIESLLKPLVEPEIVTNENAPDLSLVRDVPILDAPTVETPGSPLTQ